MTISTFLSVCGHDEKTVWKTPNTLISSHCNDVWHLFLVGAYCCRRLLLPITHTYYHRTLPCKYCSSFSYFLHWNLRTRNRRKKKKKSRVKDKVITASNNLYPFNFPKKKKKNLYPFMNQDVILEEIAAWLWSRNHLLTFPDQLKINFLNIKITVLITQKCYRNKILKKKLYIISECKGIVRNLENGNQLVSNLAMIRHCGNSIWYFLDHNLSQFATHVLQWQDK
ncbi:hypothetical protein IEQ34_011329 [Dendrobium chrysotoxum]|uniref:Uncharacterized protein n=1 Tax=Dendrobium chrysotoxum TaxID=161865 RepID=A0AAV7GVA9_DENCH|nr:hypothetical protein IEQ34_011329 [Dendrobium chrysotoxum]